MSTPPSSLNSLPSMSLANHNSYCNFRQLHVTLTPKPRTLIVSANYTSLKDNHTQIMSSSSLYEVLGVSASASCHEIKSAYRRLARVCHPDVVAVKHKEASAGEFMKIQTAYSTLSDPNKRADYDRGLYLSRWSCDSSSSSSSVSGFSGYGGKNWETDQCW